MTTQPRRGAHPQLVRALGRWSMVALAINSILGSGVFGLPSVVAGLLGGASPRAVLLAGAAMTVIIACYAEVASQFEETGGTYLYLRHAFGRLIGLQVGWMSLLSRLTACAAAREPAGGVPGRVLAGGHPPVAAPARDRGISGHADRGQLPRRRFRRARQQRLGHRQARRARGGVRGGGGVAGYTPAGARGAGRSRRSTAG